MLTENSRLLSFLLLIFTKIQIRAVRASCLTADKTGCFSFPHQKKNSPPPLLEKILMNHVVRWAWRGGAGNETRHLLHDPRPSGLTELMVDYQCQTWSSVLFGCRHDALLVPHTFITKLDWREWSLSVDVYSVRISAGL